MSHPTQKCGVKLYSILSVRQTAPNEGESFGSAAGTAHALFLDENRPNCTRKNTEKASKKSGDCPHLYCGANVPPTCGQFYPSSRRVLTLRVRFAVAKERLAVTFSKHSL